MPPTKPNHEARAQALVRHRHMREKQEFLEARKSSLQHTIETAREELTRVEVAIARNVLTMMQTPKPRIMVESFRNQTFEIPMEEEDVNARLTPSEVKAALRQSHQLRHIAKAMPAAVPITVPLNCLLNAIHSPDALDVRGDVFLERNQLLDVVPMHEQLFVKTRCTLLCNLSMPVQLVAAQGTDTQNTTVDLSAN